MLKSCPACGSPLVRRSRFRAREEHERYLLRSPYRCRACGGRFFVTSHKVRQAAVGALALIPIAYVTVGWLLTPVEIKRLPAVLPTFQSSPNSTSSPTSSAVKPETLAEMAKEAFCTSEPVNVTGETYKCATQSGLTSYFVATGAKPSVQAPIPSEGSATGALESGGGPAPLTPPNAPAPHETRLKDGS